VNGGKLSSTKLLKYILATCFIGMKVGGKRKLTVPARMA